MVLAPPERPIISLHVRPDKVSLRPEDIASAKTTVHLNNEEVDDMLDITQPAADVLPSAGRTKVTRAPRAESRAPCTLPRPLTVAVCPPRSSTSC